MGLLKPELARNACFYIELVSVTYGLSFGTTSLATSQVLLMELMSSGHISKTVPQARRKHFGSGAAIGTKKTAGGLGGAVSSPAGPGQSPGGGPGGEAPGSSVNLGILKP